MTGTEAYYQSMIKNPISKKANIHDIIKREINSKQILVNGKLMSN
jgi:hypothetical protein